MSEDCLTVNIYTAQQVCQRISRFRSCSVMTYGGGFHSGASSSFDASILVAHSISRNDEQSNEISATGGLNLGIKDFLTALKWVQPNSRTFGGDPTKVTVFGQSAREIMSSIIFLDSQVSGLARAAILFSGSAATSPDFTAPQRESLWKATLQASPHVHRW
ncbi:Alpha/Beta hydrolase protein [Mycena sp. CBHHK59/15]|nr:Alpha/Beta hydrolase protein [Mycena sp. CBHHK59/15]